MTIPSMPCEPNRRQIAIAVVGAGLIGRVHVHHVLAAGHAGCRLHSIVDSDPSAADLAAASGVAHHASLESLLATLSSAGIGGEGRVCDAPDAVIIATPNPCHVPQTMQCLDAALPVLLEKPVATSVAEGQRLARRASESGVPVLVGHHRAHGTVMQHACELIASGQLGRLVSVMGSAQFYKPESYFREAAWRTREGGGPILINLIHEVHNLRMLMGEVCQVQAMRSNAVRGFEVEDTVSIGLRFMSGALGCFLLSDTAASTASWELSSGENPDFPCYRQADCYHLAGTHGSLSIPTMTLTAAEPGQAASWWEPMTQTRSSVPLADPLQAQLSHFLAVVRGECAPRVSIEDGLANLAVVEAVREAALTGATVTLSEIGA